MIPHDVILAGVFVYFAIGATFATAMTILSLGFAGKFPAEALVIFLLWPLYFLLRIPFLIYILSGGAAALAMTFFAHLILSYFGARL